MLARATAPLLLEMGARVVAEDENGLAWMAVEVDATRCREGESAVHSVLVRVSDMVWMYEGRRWWIEVNPDATRRSSTHSRSSTGLRQYSLQKRSQPVH